MHYNVTAYTTNLIEHSMFVMLYDFPHQGLIADQLLPAAKEHCPCFQSHVPRVSFPPFLCLGYVPLTAVP